MNSLNPTKYDTKYSLLFNHLTEQIKQVLDSACEENSLDHFKIEISNHNGSVQLDYQLRERTKVY